MPAKRVKSVDINTAGTIRYQITEDDLLENVFVIELTGATYQRKGPQTISEFGPQVYALLSIKAVHIIGGDLSKDPDLLEKRIASIQSVATGELSRQKNRLSKMLGHIATRVN